MPGVEANDRVPRVVSAAIASQGIYRARAAERTKTQSTEGSSARPPVSWYFPVSFSDLNNVKTLQYVSDIFTSKRNYVSLFKYLEESSYPMLATLIIPINYVYIYK